MDPDRFDQLIADAHQRMQRRQRILKDVRDPVAAHAAQGLVTHGQGIFAADSHRAACDHARGRSDKTQQRQGGHRLAGARLPDNPQALAGAT